MLCTRKLLISRATTTLFASAAPVKASDASPTEFKQEAMVRHPRSGFSYKSSDKGEEVGARNEAAFMNYHAVEPASVTRKLAMPHVVNLLTITPIYVGVLAAMSFFYGVWLWDIYARKHYETVVIERQPQQS